ncbi:MAG: Na+/H+ antiporter NhaC family protein [Lachnospiraceae bacterium]|jgi:tetracycline resistance efflux pump
MNFGFASLIPIIICFAIVIIFKNPYIGIAGGIVAGTLLIFFLSHDFVLGSSVLEVLQSSPTMKTTLFVLIVGALIGAMEHSGGINGLVAWLDKKKINIHSKVGVQLFTMLIGMLMFVDGTSSMATTSVVGKPLFEKAGIRKEKLALIVNSTASPIAWLIPFGGAGALTSGLLSQIDEIGDTSFQTVVRAIPFQFYTLLLLVLLFLSIVLKFEIGPLAKLPPVESQSTSEEKSQIKGRARDMLLPLAVLLGGIALILAVTGQGNIMQGDSGSAVFYSGIVALIFTLIFYAASGTASVRDTVRWYGKGAGSLLAITFLLFMAYIFSNILGKIGTAEYLVGLFDTVPAALLPLLTLLVSALIAYCTGTSGGTVAIMTGLIVPMALLQGVSVPLVVGAIISGGVFGDQNSVISDSVILTSSMTGVDAVTHVRTQMPYCLIALGAAAVLYLIFGMVM